MSAQKNKNNTMSVLLILLVLVIAVLGRRLYSSAQKNMEVTPDSIVESGSSVKVGEPLVLQGSINKLKELKAYTHTLLVEEKLYGIKSSTKNLYDYTGNVSIKGKVDDIKNDIAIIEVDEIIQVQDENEIKNLDSNEKITYLPQLGLLLDLSETSGFDVEIGTETIKINDTTGTGSTVLSINPFTCTPGESLKDCDVLLDRFGDKDNQQFTSVHDITYYNMTETNTWLAFNPRNIGYYFIPGIDKDITSFVDLINFLDNTDIKKQVIDQALEVCTSLEGALDPDSTLEASIGAVKKGLTTAEITGKTKEGYDLTCTLQVKLGKELGFTYMSSTVVTSEDIPSQENEGTEKEIADNNDNKEVDKTTPDDQEVIATGTPNVNSLRIRSSKDIGDNILGAAKAGDQIDILEIGDERLKILFENKIARVKKSFIEIKGGDPTAAGEESPADRAQDNEDEENEEEEAIAEDDKEEPIDEKEAQEDNEADNIPTKIIGGTSYTSSQGYTLTFSNKNIAYDGSTNNNRIEGCTQSINVIRRVDADNVNSSPDIVVHVCPTEKSDAGDLIGTINDKYFYVESKTNNLQTEIAVSGALE